MQSAARGSRIDAVARPIAISYLALLWGTLSALSLWNVQNRNAWPIGDWLINYQGGFVRRGLPGELARRFGDALHVSPAACVGMFQVALYGVLFMAVWKLVRGSSWSLWVLAFLFSPVTLAFPVLDAMGGFRKEELYLTGLAVLLLLLRSGRLGDRLLALYLAAVLAGLALSHEALVLFAPYFLVALALHFGDWRRVARVGAPAAVVGLALWLVAVTHPGNARIAQEVCASLGSQNAAFCDGPIAALGDTAGVSRGQVRQMIALNHPVRFYAGLLPLVLLPAVLAMVRLRQEPGRRHGVWMIGAGCLATCACSSVLFVYALDWGRWIYIHVFSLFLLLLFADQRRDGHRAETTAWEFRTPLRVACSVMLLAVFATTWNMPRLPLRTLRHGYFSLFGGQSRRAQTPIAPKG